MKYLVKYRTVPEDYAMLCGRLHIHYYVTNSGMSKN